MDLRIQFIFDEEMKGDSSFQDKGGFLSGLFGRNYYSDSDMRETWNRGIKHGIEIGLRRASVEGEIIELNQNTPDGKNKEFLEKFYKLAEEYDCVIQYHYELGMVVLDNTHKPDKLKTK